MGHEVHARLYVCAGADTDPQQVAACLDAAGAATLLIVAPLGGALTPAAARPLVELAQKKDVAALIDGDAQLARTLRADGVHLPWSKDVAARYAEAREILGTRYIVGVDVGRSRHDAMSLAEDGADYIAFGIPPHVEDRASAAERRLELVGWWSEIFEVPCVAFDVEDAEDAAALAAAGADFIAMRPKVVLSADNYGKLASTIAETLADERTRDLVERLRERGLQMVEERTEAADGPLSGRTFVITGTLPNLSRDEATQRIEAADGKVTGSVSKKTDYLVAGDSPGSKLAKAEEVGTEILDEDGLRALLP